MKSVLHLFLFFYKKCCTYTVSKGGGGGGEREREREMEEELQEPNPKMLCQSLANQSNYHILVIEKNTNINDFHFIGY
jgi:hypothetical protein